VAVDSLLANLDKVKTVPGKHAGNWKACCPAHDDNTPSLAISETSDGEILINCWAGCSSLDVISAVGMEWDSLFPPNTDYRPERVQRRDTRLDRLITETLGYISASSHDQIIIDLARADAKAGVKHSDEDRLRIRQAIESQARRNAA